MAFIQIIEYQTSRIEEVIAVSNEFRGEWATRRVEGPKPLRGTITTDRDRPGYYLSIIEFDTYEAAMESSNRPETQQFFGRLSQLLDGPPKFYNLEVVDTWEM
jgi:hypothetical protein